MFRLTRLFAAAAMAACTADPTHPGDGGEDLTPLPIDAPGAATSYKGLPLALAGHGQPAVTAVDGVIGVVCIGMSNGNQECGEWIVQVAGAWQDEVSPAVRIVNCAVGGHAIERWTDPAFDGALWDDCAGRKLPQAGVRLDQVRVVWHKAASQFAKEPDGSALPPYPDPASDYFAFIGHLDAFASRVKESFPAVQAVYTSSRSYGGFSARSDRGEPLSYEEGHALNTWLADHPTVDGVWYGWGAYLWAPDCATGGRNGAGICYHRSDYQDDAVHPSEAGRLKIARLVHDRMRQHEWYRP